MSVALCISFFFMFGFIVSDPRMPVQDKNRRFSRAERRGMKALLGEAKSENDKAETVNVAMKEKEEFMRLVIAALEGHFSVESK